MDIDLNDYEHLKELSSYNNNYYKHKKANTSTLLVDRFNEEFQHHELYLYDGIDQIFLGCCPWKDGTQLLGINIGEMYT